MRITGKGEYGGVISRHFQSSFPKIAAVKGKDLLEILTTILVGSKDLRYGNLPSPESLVTIRKTISKAIELNLPIPVLIPWGGRKMDKRLSLDVAEVSALKQLLRVDECIRDLYAPGMLMNIRIEDINAEWLYKESTGIEEYSSGMKSLVEMLKGDSKLYGVRESDMMSKNQYFDLAKEYSELLFTLITTQLMMPTLQTEDIPAYQELVARGWKGTIPEEQRDYYLDRYAKLYPGMGKDDHIAMLADYFAGSKVRYDLNGRGNPVSDVGSFIQINFAHPVPGAPDGIFNNTLYYRTIPGNMTRTHIAPWRAKGYLEIDDADRVTPKLVHPGTEVPRLETSYINMTPDDIDKPVVIRADYAHTISVAEAMAYMPMMM